MTAPITYAAHFIEDPTPTFLRLWNEISWLRHDKVPRREYFVSRVGEPYAYGKAAYARTYQPQESHDAIEKIWRRLETKVNCTFDVCFLNGYENQHDQLGWHADDSPEMDDNKPIAVVSLMQHPDETREIWFRPRDAKEPVEKLALGSGSMVLMASGMQDTHLHRIPKADRPCGARISLTFRGYVKPEGP